MLSFTLKQLLYFSAVAKKGSLAAAAEELGVSQPSVSKSIFTLEKKLKTPLFIRHHAQGVSLTQVGQDTLQYANILLRQAEEFERWQSHRNQTAPLKVGCYSTFAPLVLPRLIVAYKNQYPDRQITIYEGTQENLISQVLFGELDIIIVYHFKLHDELFTRKIVDLQPKALVSAKNPIANQKSVSLQQLAQYPFIMLDIPMSRKYFESIFKDTGYPIDVVYYAKTIEMIRGLVGQEWGVSLLTTHSQAIRTYDGNQIVSVPLSQETRPSSIHLAHALGPAMHQSGRNFLDFCIQYKEFFY